MRWLTLCLVVAVASLAGASPVAAEPQARFSTVSCTTTAGTLVGRNNNRTKLLVTNRTGQASIYQGPTTSGTTLTTTNGIEVEGGRSLSFTGGEAAVPRQCVTAAVTVTIQIEEGFE